MHGMKRLYEGILKEYLAQFPCVAVLGPRQCGKTTLLHTLPGIWTHFDLERGSDYAVIANDPDLFFRLNSTHVALDEAQLLPAIFPALRVAIDADRSQKGRYVISGSSSPELLRSVSESLAGRVAILEMSPLMWAELTDCQVSGLIQGISSGERNVDVLRGELRPRASLELAHDFWLRGGYPEPWIADDPIFARRWMDQYARTYLERDVMRLFPGLDHARYRLFLQMLGGLSGQVINLAQVSRALGVSQPTVRDYFDIAHGTFVWRKLPAYGRNVTKRIVKHAKGYLRDSGVLHQLLRIPDLDALLGHPQVGLSWEGLVIEEIIRQFNVLGESVEASFYRTSGGAEVDLICEGRFGVIPFEIKRGQRVDLRDCRGIRDFVREQGCPFGIIINNDTAPRLYDENLLGVPFAYL